MLSAAIVVGVRWREVICDCCDDDLVLVLVILHLDDLIIIHDGDLVWAECWVDGELWF